MNNSFYFKLALTNLKKNGKTYFPYIIAAICAVITFYTMKSMVLNKGLDTMRGAYALKSLLGFTSYVIAIFSIIFLFYTNSFLIKRRKKEIGLYNILGMEKKHIAKVLFFETLIVAVISLVLGLIGGILISKLLFLILLNLMKFKVTLSFSISIPAIISTVKIFNITFIVILIKNFIQVKISNPIELLKGGEKGERVPKTSKFLAISGIIELMIGYGIAITVKSPVEALQLFFIAVLLVMAGTYSTFRAGSIALLKLLKKNKKFFYKTNNFISVSGMIYRMKQNAIGLANICILSTAVLLTVSTTVCLYVGQEDSLRDKYPQDISISIDNGANENAESINYVINEEVKYNNINLDNKITFNYIEMMTIKNGDAFEVAQKDMSNISRLYGLTLLTLKDYNQIEGKDSSLENNEVLIFSQEGTFNEESINIGQKEYKIKDELNSLRFVNKQDTAIIKGYYIVVKDSDVLKNIYKDMTNEDLESIKYNISFDVSGDKNYIMNFCSDISSKVNEMYKGDFTSIYTDRQELFTINGGFLFIGVFLGLLFTMATVLIIYYKQISEGYDDSERFKIMQKVGMSKEEVKRTISKQILMVFFLPLVTAVIHIVFAFKVMKKMLALFAISNTSIFLQCTLGTMITFAIVYILVYMITAKTYYKIVEQED
ncbi:MULTISPECIES: ABC transporter permease [Clostridium]|uniref:ABC transporter permease n=1 Tax=Clostridium aquiflavi TaxID=3073603 RepID=A0ABU1EG40_9CLOT|nr:MULTISPECIES: ABC transporter permease [unclassified Clostridium]MDR5587356.1 ABC transporter permease [Clostridium sp. 5N-1]NFG62006.1 ABC transporter permease [Clostridium botulinum]NFQ08326.1 ABC transporter permease [Clostridium botulinum]